MKIKNLINEIIEDLDLLKKEELNKQSNSLIDILIEKNEYKSNIFIYGAGRSGFIGRGLVMRLVQSGFKAFFIGESSTPPMNQDDLLIMISGSAKTDIVKKVLTISKDNGLKIVLITSHAQHNISGIEYTISVEGKVKTDPNNSSLPLGSYFELNSFIFLECLLAKLIDKSSDAKKNMDKIAKKYRENKLIVN